MCRLVFSTWCGRPWMLSAGPLLVLATSLGGMPNLKVHDNFGTFIRCQLDVLQQGLVLAHWEPHRALFYTQILAT